MDIETVQTHDNTNPIISIVIPTRNEEKDIAETLERCLALHYEPKEIIIVDDSTDNTPAIVAGYADRGVRLIHREVNRNGCCGARNLGMQSARGEILVVLNADNRPRPDFLNRILEHYLAGADFVLVRPEVQNRDNIWGQYVYVTGIKKRQRKDWQPTWTEGFSCRRVAAEAVGYIPGDFSIPFCRDHLIGIALERAGFKKCVDRTILMEHVVPDSLNEYWHNQVWRGSFAVLHAYYFWGMSVPLIVARELLKSMRVMLLYFLVLPILWREFRHVRYTDRHWGSLPGLLWVGTVRDMADIVGSAKSLIRLLQVEGFNFHAQNKRFSTFWKGHRGYIDDERYRF